jgi:hypothetical protein
MLAILAAAATPPQRTAPELSDIALFGFACLALWFVRRALRRRFHRD